MKKKRCPICNSSFNKVLLSIKIPDRFESFAGITSVGYKRYWIECSNCGVAVNIRGYTSAKLKELETAYYEVDFKNSSIAEKYKKVMALPSEKSDNAQRVLRIHNFANEWFKNTRANSKVLDIGAGTGVFLARFLKQHSTVSWQGTAVESDPLACKHLRSLKLFKVIEGVFPSKFNLKKFDLCALNKIVEHIKNPVSFLKNVRKTLNPKRGILYIEVPDKMTIDFRPPTDNILGALHHHLYDLKSLALLLEKSGFVPLQVLRFFEPSGKISVAAFATSWSAIRSIVVK